MFASKSIGLLIVSLLMFGCTRSMNPVSSSSTPGNVTMSVAFSNSATTGLSKVSSVNGATSIRIDSAVIVLAGIKFENAIDSVQIDTSGDSPLLYVDGSDSSVIFRGPFVIHVRDTVAIDFASQTLPAGTYTGIRFAIRRLGFGEGYHDSDHFNNPNAAPPDTSVQNYCLAVWGAVYKDSAWVPFEFKENQNLEFKVRGNITIPNATTSVNVALNFNMGSWFVNPVTGATLDPTDMTWQNQMMIRQAIRASFGDGSCYREMNRFGHHGG